MSENKNEILFTFQEFKDMLNQSIDRYVNSNTDETKAQLKHEIQNWIENMPKEEFKKFLVQFLLEKSFKSAAEMATEKK